MARSVTVNADELAEFTKALLVRAKMPDDMAAAAADILVEGDLLGHSTHGVGLLPQYLSAIENGTIALEGAPEVVSERGAVQAWDGRLLPGAWVTLRAIATASEMAREYGTGTIAIARSHHIGCLAAYLERVAAEGLILELLTSAPSAASVVPHGGKDGALSPSPIAFGYPTETDPVMIDISTSLTSNNHVMRVKGEGAKLDYPWMLDADGVPTDDPELGKTLLPLGGVEAGHKGFGLGLMVEALTAGLGGMGRMDDPVTMCGNVYVQVTDPEAFAGLGVFKRQAQQVSDICTSVRPVDPVHPVRLPGRGGLERKARQRSSGVVLSASIWGDLTREAETHGVALPKPH